MARKPITDESDRTAEKGNRLYCAKVGIFRRAETSVQRPCKIFPEACRLPTGMISTGGHNTDAATA